MLSHDVFPSKCADLKNSTTQVFLFPPLCPTHQQRYNLIWEPEKGRKEKASNLQSGYFGLL